ncbi:MAG: DNA-binding response regulator [Alphaproteobacteria bacterium CG_4_9_14_3_um_filter_47_13]|nr:MAG: DNA-binding response regulator [Alphaproteobacteria bacterium CG_4_9_14_3_um_filter_47_13]
MKLLVADDHALFREALTQFIERAEPDCEVLQAKDMHEVMGIMEGNSEIDLVLLDMRMPGMDGVNGLERILQTYPETPVALLSGLAEKFHVEKAMKMGACGFFPKTMSGKALLNGVQKILEGEQYIAIDHNINDIMPSYFGHDPQEYQGLHDTAQAVYHTGIPGKLTPREKEVLSYLLKGSSNKEIANSLALQVVTVKLHIRGICRKLNSRNRTQAALKAQQLGLVIENQDVV